jgi:hypothetical protein
VDATSATDRTHKDTPESDLPVESAEVLPSSSSVEDAVSLDMDQTPGEEALLSGMVIQSSGCREGFQIPASSIDVLSFNLNLPQVDGGYEPDDLDLSEKVIQTVDFESFLDLL